jgi:hypothetical protein
MQVRAHAAASQGSFEFCYPRKGGEIELALASGISQVDQKGSQQALVSGMVRLIEKALNRHLIQLEFYFLAKKSIAPTPVLNPVIVIINLFIYSIMVLSFSL